MYKDYSRMSASSRKSVSKSAQAKVDSAELGSDSGSLLYEKSAKRIGEAVNQYCRKTLTNLKHAEEMVKSLEKLGGTIGGLTDEKNVLDTAKDIYEAIAETQKVLDKTKIETSQLRITVDDLTGTLRSGREPDFSALNEKEYAVSFVSDLDISHDDDGYLAYHIYSIQSLEDGRLVLADYWNKTIKVVDNSEKVSYALKCKGNPWGLCKTKEDEFAVTLTDTQCIQIITLAGDGTLEISKEILVNEPCRGIFPHEDNFYVACAGFGNEGPGHLRIIMADGKQKVIKDDVSGKQMFSRPRQVFVNSPKDEVFVTDADDVKVFDLQGNEVRRIKDNNLKSPFGITGDGKGGVLVSGFMSHNVFRVDQRNKKMEVIRDGQISSPVSLFLHPKTDMLFVGMERKKDVKLFNVSK